MVRIVARRTVKTVRRGRVGWIRTRSDEAIDAWEGPIDFLFIDADHSYERARSDWRLWTPFVRPGGYVAMHDSAVFAGGWTDERTGPVRLLHEITSTDSNWHLVAQADSLSVLEHANDVDADRLAK
jgi:predicted O-methyltransferase YrrM